MILSQGHVCVDGSLKYSLNLAVFSSESESSSAPKWFNTLENSDMLQCGANSRQTIATGANISFLIFKQQTSFPRTETICTSLLSTILLPTLSAAPLFLCIWKKMKTRDCHMKKSNLDLFTNPWEMGKLRNGGKHIWNWFIQMSKVPTSMKIKFVEN